MGRLGTHARDAQIRPTRGSNEIERERESVIYAHCNFSCQLLRTRRRAGVGVRAQTRHLVSSTHVGCACRPAHASIMSGTCICVRAEPAASYGPRQAWPLASEASSSCMVRGYCLASHLVNDAVPWIDARVARIFYVPFSPTLSQNDLDKIVS